MLKSKIDKLVSDATEILNIAHDFFLKVPVIYKPLNNQGSSFVILGFSNYRWGTLEGDLLKLQDELLSKYESWFASSKELVNRFSPDRLDEFIKNYIYARSWIELHGEVWDNDKEKIFFSFRANFKKQVDMVSSLLSIIEMNEGVSFAISNTRTTGHTSTTGHSTVSYSTIESDKLSSFNNELIILRYRVERLEEEIKEQRTQTYSLATGTKGLEIKIHNIANSSADIGNISVDVKNEIIVESVKPLLDAEIGKLKAIILETETENKKEILSICDEILSAEKPASSWLKNKGQKLLDLCKVKFETLEKVSMILQIISTVLSILNSNGQVT